MKFRSVMTFDGVNDSVTVADNEHLRISTYTVELWLKPHGKPAGWTGIAGKPGRNMNIWLHPAGYIHHRFHNAGSTNAGIGDTPHGSVRWNQWSHVAITNDGTTAVTYIDGELKAKGPTGGSMIVDDTAFILGSSLDGNANCRFRGDMAEVRVWNAVRSQEDIQASMKKPLSGHEEGLVLYLPLTDDEAKDVSEHGLNGTIVGDPQVSFATDLPLEGSARVSARKTPVLTFDGKDDFVQLSKSLSTVESAITVEFWAKGTSNVGNQTSVIEAHNAENARTLNIHLPWSSRVYWDAGGQGGYDRVDDAIRADEYKGSWNHWAFVKNASTGVMLVYRNGESRIQGIGKSKALTGIDKLVIGSYVDHSHPWAGSIAELRIWNTARTRDQLLKHMHHRIHGDEQGLAGYWPLDENEGDTIHDQSAQENHGAITGANWSEAKVPLLDAAPRLVEHEGEVVVVDIGRKYKRRAISRLRKGEGKLSRELQRLMDVLVEEGSLGSNLQPIVIVLKEKNRGPGGMW